MIMMELMKYTDFFPFPQEKLNPLHFGVLRANRSKQQPLDLHAPLNARSREAVLGQTITCLRDWRLRREEGQI